MDTTSLLSATRQLHAKGWVVDDLQHQGRTYDVQHAPRETAGRRHDDELPTGLSEIRVKADEFSNDG